MGLSIKGTNKTFKRSYSGIHHIRWLAMLTLGAPKSLNRNWMYSPNFNTVTDSSKYQELLSSAFLTGFYYPNLFFHSDCQGTYTKTGKILESDELKTGNIKKLYKELIKLKGSITEDLEKENQYAVELLNELFDLVDDEIKYGKNKLLFC
jgi:hypothetical protein